MAMRNLLLSNSSTWSNHFSLSRANESAASVSSPLTATKNKKEANSNLKSGDSNSEQDEDTAEARLRLVVRTFQEELDAVQRELKQARDEIGQFRQEKLDRQAADYERQQEEAEQSLSFERIWEKSCGSGGTDDGKTYNSRNDESVNDHPTVSQKQDLKEASLSGDEYLGLEDESHGSSKTRALTTSSIVTTVHDRDVYSDGAILHVDVPQCSQEEGDDETSQHTFFRDEADKLQQLVQHLLLISHNGGDIMQLLSRLKDESSSPPSDVDNSHETGSSQKDLNYSENGMVSSSEGRPEVTQMYLKTQAEEIRLLQEKLEKEALLSHRKVVHRQIVEVYYKKALDEKEAEVKTLLQERTKPSRKSLQDEAVLTHKVSVLEGIHESTGHNNTEMILPVDQHKKEQNDLLKQTIEELAQLRKELAHFHAKALRQQLKQGQELFIPHCVKDTERMTPSFPPRSNKSMILRSSFVEELVRKLVGCSFPKGGRLAPSCLLLQDDDRQDRVTNEASSQLVEEKQIPRLRTKMARKNQSRGLRGLILGGRKGYKTLG